MRQIMSKPGEYVEIRADEFDWMPIENSNGEVWHTLVNEEDGLATKDDKLNLRRQNRKNKRLRHEH